MKILAVIPARGASKRIPGKNLRPLGGRPLLLWSIESGKAASGIADVIVSTDDAAIADVARKAGAIVPWLRPAELSTDDAMSADVCIHAVDWYEAEKGKVDGVLMLQPTSPFRRQESVERGVALFREQGGKPVIGVSPAASHPMWCFRVDGARMTPFVTEGDGWHTRSQDLPKAYCVNGAFYLIRPEDLRARRSFYEGHDLVPLVMDGEGEAIDIDTEADWKRAEGAIASGGILPE
jgi:CMP-N,N'-diacetyllegionaminic acid synthase